MEKHKAMLSNEEVVLGIRGTPFNAMLEATFRSCSGNYY